MIGLADPWRVELEPFAVGFNTDTITDIAHAGDERLFVAQREGLVRIVYSDGTIEPTPFLSLRGSVTVGNWEQGLLGLAFHPRFPKVPYFYVTYTDVDSQIRLTRFSVPPEAPNTADRHSGRLMMIVDKPRVDGTRSRIHNGGDLAFGPEGYLYLSLGDGGPTAANGEPGDPNNNGQRTDTLLGSLLRIDVDPDRGRPPDCGVARDPLYSIPPDNPYLAAEGCDEIWATGLRNPWRISFDVLTGDLYISDVGENLREEINYQPAGSAGGANFGWHCYEGGADYGFYFPLVRDDCDPQTPFVFPAYEYSSAFTGMCAVIGGLVYRGEQYPQLYGRYLFGDFCQGSLWTLAWSSDSDGSGNWKATLVGQTDLLLSTFGQDINGELYVGGRTPGPPNTLYRIIVP